MCINYEGGFRCDADYNEYVAIGFGGHTTNGAEYPSEVSVVSQDQAVCGHHYIDNTQGRFHPAVVANSNKLWICGGFYSGGTARSKRERERDWEGSLHWLVGIKQNVA